MRYLLFYCLFFVTAICSAQTRQSLDRALFFAVDDYEKMTDLYNPIKNAQSISLELENRYGFLTEIVSNPTIEHIESKIADYKRRYASGSYAKEGQLLIFFTGHGVMKGSNGYFMPADADPKRPYVSGIEYDYWRNEINSIDCRHILVAIDACHSITFDPNWKTKTDRIFSRPGEQFNDQILSNHAAYRARLFFTSDAKGNQTPDRSTFAQQFLAGLRNYRTTTGYLTSSELFANYMQKAAPTPGGGSFGNDEPGSTFLFFQKTIPQTNTAPTELATWQKTQQLKTISAYQQFLSQFPNGDFAPIAREKIDELKHEDTEVMDWQRAKANNTAKAYRAFMEKHPQSPYYQVAIRRLESLQKRGNQSASDNMVFVKGGTFQMGSENGESDQVSHMVSLSNYYISRYEVTFDEYDIFCAATGRERPAEEVKKRQKRPVSYVNWYDALDYCNWLSKEKGLQVAYTIEKNKRDPNNLSSADSLKWIVGINWDANGYRLPTEAEWEYAARSCGKTQKWAGTSRAKILSSYGNYLEGSLFNASILTRMRTSPVGILRPNDLGLFDMSGNVAEWCWDWYASYSKGTKTNPSGPNTGSERVLRGGSYRSPSDELRCSYRGKSSPNQQSRYIGFRISRAAH